MKKLIVHVSSVEVALESGMGRIEWYWREALQNRGYEVVHLGPREVGPVPHDALFPLAAWRAYQKLGRKADLFFVHEPSSGAFARRGVPLVIESHGFERRNWQRRLSRPELAEGPLSLKTRILFPLRRLWQADRGIRAADLLLIANSEDAEYAREEYGLSSDKLFLYRNGVNVSTAAVTSPTVLGRVLFNGSWIPRKGTWSLVGAAVKLRESGVDLQWTLAGTGFDADVVMRDWPEALRGSVRVIPKFSSEAETELYREHNVFVLPSLYEGQPLSLLQAMERGLCCVASDCCGQRDLIKHDTNGLLFEPGDVGALAHQLGRVCRDGALISRLGQAARESVKDRQWRVVAEEVAERVEKLLLRL